jgi:hypothetical protein
VVGLRVAPAELHREIELNVVFQAPDGAQLSSAAARIRADGPGDGRDSILTFSLDLWNLVFPAGGEYRIRLLLEGQERKQLPLMVELQAAGTAAFAPPFPPPTGQA